MSELQKIMNEIASWSDSVFGEGRPPTAPLHHLKKEVREAIENPDDDSEYADMLMLILDAYRMKGGTANELIKYTYNKLEENKQRKWGKPDKNGVVEHVRNKK